MTGTAYFSFYCVLQPRLASCMKTLLQRIELALFKHHLFY